MGNEKKEYLGINIEASTKTKLKSLALENGRTMSAQIIEMINRDYKKMLSAHLKADQKTQQVRIK